MHGLAGWTGGSFNISRLGTGGYDANGNDLSSTGDPFASFLLGQVQTANFLIPAFTTFTGNFGATYINDDYKVTSKLNLTLGMRFDYQGAWRERFDRFSAFDSTVPNSTAGGRLAALAFAGSGPGRTGYPASDTMP